MRLPAFLWAICAGALTSLCLWVAPVRALPLAASVPNSLVRVLPSATGVTHPPTLQPQAPSLHVCTSRDQPGCNCPACQQVGFARIQGQLPL